MTDANGNRAELAYDGYDRQIAWRFPSKSNGSVTASCNLGNVTEINGVSGPSESSASGDDCEKYGYDRDNNRATLVKRDGSVIRYGFDGLNRMASKVVPDGCAPIQSGACPASSATRDVYYGYDLRGLQTYARFNSASGDGVGNVYDGFGELTSTTVAMGGTSRTLTSQYDADGNRTKITHPDNVSFDLQYDGLDRLMYLNWTATGMSWIDGGTGTMQIITPYLPGGERWLIARPSGGTVFSYDGIGRLTGTTQLMYQGTGNYTDTLSYNPASQITGLTRSTDDYAWDGAVNVDRTYGVNGLNQYTTAGPASFAYDASGNLISDGTVTYAYDAENRLVSSSNGTTLAYDPLGRLWQVARGGTGTTQFLYDGDELAVEYDGGSGALLRRYLFAGQDEPLVWGEGSALDCSNLHFLHADHEGSVLYTTDCDANRQVRNTYDEYGIPGTGNAGRFQYTGQAWLPELGMYYYKARMYSPTLGRFLQTDPIGYKDQVNLYAYVGNDPVNARDPTGMWLFPWEKPVYVQGGTPGQRKRVEEAVGRVLATDRGREIESDIRGGWIFHGDPVTIVIGPDPDGTNTPRDSDGDHLRTIKRDPRDFPSIVTSLGPVKPSVERVIGHEFGHAVKNAEDDGPDQMSNVEQNENPVARSLGLAPRTQYDTAPPGIKAPAERPRCPKGSSCAY